MSPPTTVTPASSEVESGSNTIDRITSDPVGEFAATAGEVWRFKLFAIDNADVTVGQLVIALLMLVVGVVVARVVSAYVGKRALPRFRIERGAAAAIQTIVYYLLLTIGVMLAVNTAGVPMTVFTIFGGALALGIGFGSQNIVNNFISGLILLIERPIGVGQLVEVGGNMGVIQKIGARSTHMQGYDGKTVVIPNSALLESAVTNFDEPDSKYRSRVAVGVAYGSDTKIVRDLLLRVASEHERVLKSPEPVALFLEFGDNALGFELHVWIKPRSVEDRLRIESDLRYHIDELCRDAGVSIAFPQRDVHLDTNRPLEVRVTSGG
jgi:small-conductance mechanosensitive channel